MSAFGGKADVIRRKADTPAPMSGILVAGDAEHAYPVLIEVPPVKRCRQDSLMLKLGISQHREDLMHAVVRSYSGSGAKELFDLLEQRLAEVESLIRGVQGFCLFAHPHQRWRRHGDGLPEPGRHGREHTVGTGLDTAERL